MIYTPYYYDEINLAAGQYSPSPVKAYNNASFAYWCRSLCQRLQSVIIIDRLPSDWQGSVRDYLYFCLIRWGYVGVFRRAAYGTIFTAGNISGKNLYYQPVYFTVSNPAFKDSLELKIGEGCQLIKWNPDYIGCWDIIERYAAELSELDNSINIAAINSKISWILGAKNKSAAEAIKKALDKINKGEPAVVVDSKIMSAAKKPGDDVEPWVLMDLEVKKNYILTDLLQDQQTMLNNFDSEVGIPTVPYQKKERLTAAEPTMRIYDGSSRAQVWLDTLNSSMTLVNDMFGLDLSAKMRYPAEPLSPAESEASDGNS